MNHTVERVALTTLALVAGGIVVVGEVLDQHWLRAALVVAVIATMAAMLLRPTKPRPAPEGDPTWARELLAGRSVSPTDPVRAVKTLRDAQPQLTLVEAKQLVDAVRRADSDIRNH